MNRRIAIFTVLWATSILIGSFNCHASATEASQPLKAIEGLNMDKAATVEEIAALVAKLKVAAASIEKQDKSIFPFQEAIVSKSGACILRIASLTEGAAASSPKTGELLTDIRLILTNIRSTNKAAIDKIEKNRLETIKDPNAFFKSDPWKKPLSLVSMSSYWLGWTDYYAGRMLSDSDPEKRNVLEGAIRTFAFVFSYMKEEHLMANTLFGRALCHKELKEFDKSLRDLVSARGILTKEDELYFKLLFEEASVNFQTGNLEAALDTLDTFMKGPHHVNTSEAKTAEINHLRVKVLTAILEKSRPETEAEKEATRQKYTETFERFKSLAENNKQLGIEFYQFVKSHGAEFDQYTLEALGPWGQVAIGDYFYDKGKFFEAMGYYEHLNAMAESVPAGMLDNIWFRLADIRLKQDNQLETVNLLEKLLKKYPDSPHIGEASRLYYAAAVKLYTTEPSEQAYATSIDAAKAYVGNCTDCPDLSEAHFQLGKFYQKKGQPEKALTEFSQVGPESPNHIIAQYYVLQDILEQLQYLERHELIKSEKAQKLYAEGVKRIAECQNQPWKDREGLSKTQLAQMDIIHAEIFRYGPKNAGKDMLKSLEGFEQRHPGDSRQIYYAKLLRIKAYQNLGMFKDASHEITKIMSGKDIDPDRFNFLKDTANYLFREFTAHEEGKEKELTDFQSTTAHTIYQKLFRITQTTPAYRKEGDSIQHRIAELYMNEDKFDKAREVYEEILRKNPQSASAYYNLGAIYEKFKLWTEAYDNWQRFMDRVEAGSYHWYESRYRSATASVELGKKDRACEIIKTTLAHNSEQGEDHLIKKFQLMQLEICSGN